MRRLYVFNQNSNFVFLIIHNNIIEIIYLIFLRCLLKYYFLKDNLK